MLRRRLLRSHAHLSALAFQSAGSFLLPLGCSRREEEEEEEGHFRRSVLFRARKGHNNTLSSSSSLSERESSKTTTTKNRSKKRESRHRAPPERAAETSAKKNATRFPPHRSFLLARISRVVSPRARSRRPLSLLFPRARVVGNFFCTIASRTLADASSYIDVEKHNLHHQRDTSPSVKNRASFSSSKSSSSKSFRVPLIFPVLSFECLSSSTNAVFPHAHFSFFFWRKTLNVQKP